MESNEHRPNGRHERSSPPPGGADRRFIDLAILAALAVLPFLNALRGAFVFDDVWLVIKHPAVHGPFDLGSALTSHYWGLVKRALLWRPITTLSFAVDARIAESPAWWFHLVNVLLHAGVTILWAFLVRRLTKRDGLAFIAAALFAVHPIHTEAVTWISGRAEILAALFTLTAIHLSLAQRRALRYLTPVAAFLAVASKESAIVLPLALIYLGWAFRGDKRLFPARIVRMGIVCLIPAALYVVLRASVLGTWSGPATGSMDNPMAGAGFFPRLPTVLDAAGRYILLLLWPARLSLDYSAPVLGMVRAITPQLVIGLASGAGLIYVAARARARPAGWGAGLALLSFALGSNFAYVIGTIFAERLLYLPSAGLLLILAAGALALADRLPALRSVLQGLLIVVLAAGAVRTWIRNEDYRSEAILYRAEARTHPNSPKMRYNVALQAKLEGNYEEAVREAQEAMRLSPVYPDPRPVLATSLDKLGRTKEAINFLEYVVATDRTDYKSRTVLARLLDESGRGDRADSLIAVAVRETPDQVETISMAARRAQNKGEFASAARLWRQAIEKGSEDAEVPLFLGYSLLASGDMRGARDVYREALRRTPGLPDAANGLAWTLLETGGSTEEAVRLAASAVRKAPLAPFYDTLARAHLEAGNCNEALTAALTSIGIDSTNASYQRRLQEVQARCK